MKEKIKIKIDLLNPSMFEFEYKNEIYQKFKEMIVDIMQSNIEIKIDDISHEIRVRFQEEKKKYFRYCITLVLDFMVDMEELFENHKIYPSNKKEEINLSQKKEEELTRSHVISEIEKYIMDFTFAMNLAYPGFFEFGGARLFINNKESKSSKIGTMLVSWLDVYTNFLKNKWPIMNQLKFEQVWKWLYLRTNFMEGMSKTPIDRALNALTYTMGDTSYEQFFYILVGIEALYNDNKSNGIVEQIRVKTESLLKRPETFKKSISKLYDNRSDFVHGRLNFPNKYYIYDATEEFENFFFNKYAKTVYDAMSILISTIQEYVIKDASKMKTNVITTLEK